MRARLGAGLGLALLLAVSTAPRAGDWTATTGGHVDWYTDDGSPSSSGRLLFVPMVLGYQAERWGLRVSGGYAASAFRPDDGQDADLDHPIDTTVSATWWPSLLGGQAILGADLDLPSGKSRLDAREQLAVQDRDLVLISNFGTGFNANLHVDWARTFGRVTAGLGGGYLLKRKFDPTVDISRDDLDPGNQWTASARVEGVVGDAWRLGLQLTHMRFGTDERGDQRFFQVGPMWVVAASVDYRPEPWWARLSVQGISTDKHRRLDESGELTTEGRRGSGDTILVGVEVGYVVSDALAVRAMADLYHVGENGYAPDSPFFDAGRTKAALGPGITWSPRRNVTLDASVKVFSLWDAKDAVRARDTRFTGVHVDVLVTFRF